MRKLFILCIIFLTSPAFAGTNEQAAGGWAQRTYLVPMASSMSADSTGRYSVPLSEVFSLLTSSDVGLGNVDNTADTDKPVSTATQTALDLKANTSALGSSAYLDYGTSLNSVVTWQNASYCSNAAYTDQTTCEANAGAWTIAVGLPIGTFNPSSWAGYKVNGTAVFNLGTIANGQVPVWNSTTGQFDPGSAGSGSVDDTAYAASWNGVTTTAPSQNAVYDEVEVLRAQIDTLSSAFAALNNAFSAANAPVLLSAVLGTDGTTLTLGFNETVNVGAGGSGGWNVDASTTGNDIAATYSSGDGTTSLAYTLASAVTTGETVDVDYTQPGNGIEDNDGTDLLSIVSAAVTNNSEYTGPLYLFEEEFGTGSDANWTAAGSGSYSANWNNTTSPMSGAAMLTITNDDTSYVTYAHTLSAAQSDLYMAGLVNWDKWSFGTVSMFIVQDASGNALASVNVGISGAVTANVSGAGSGTVGTLSTGSTVGVQIHYVAGTAGTAATATVWLSSDGGATWGTPQTATAGSVGVTANAAKVALKADFRTMGGAVTSYDAIRVDTSQVSY